MRIAIVGAGIAGLAAAERLHRRHEVTVFEAAAEPGGHTRTIEVERGGRRFAIDVGFIVFNRDNYPGFSALLDRLGVASRRTSMTFGLRDERTGLEYSSHSLGTLFAQRANLWRPSHLRFVAELWRFSRTAGRLLEPRRDPHSRSLEPRRDPHSRSLEPRRDPHSRSLEPGAGEPSLGEWLEREGYGPELVERFVVPVGAALWSTPPRDVLSMPARFYVAFLVRHRMLRVFGQRSWRVVRGGSRTYVRAIAALLGARLRCSTPVASIARRGERVWVRPRGGDPAEFDHVILAAHPDQALRLLEDPTDAERAVLGAMRYQPNEVVLHTDARVLPRSRRAWAAWNYHLRGSPGSPVAVTYNMNLLQGVRAPEIFCVTLNRTDDIDPARVLHRERFEHPLFDAAAVAAQRRHGEISGVRGTHYCGAGWGYGFHEDGVRSALGVVERIDPGARA